jgi:hypothetical protein
MTARAKDAAWAGVPAWIGMIEVWWIYVVVVLVLAAGIYAFIELTGARTRLMNKRSTRTAESMYDNYADSYRKQRRYAREHGGEWRDDSSVNPPGQSG